MPLLLCSIQIHWKANHWSHNVNITAGAKISSQISSINCTTEDNGKSMQRDKSHSLFCLYVHLGYFIFQQYY